MKPPMLALLALLPLAAAQTGNYAAALIGGYVTGTTPTSLIVTSDFTTGISTVGQFVKITFTAKMFIPSSTPTATASGGTNVVFSHTSASSDGKEIWMFLGSGSVDLGSTMVFTISDNFEALPDPATMLPVASEQEMNIISSQDSAIARANVFNVISVPTFTLATVNTNIGTLPTSLQLIWEQPLPITSGDNIIISAYHQISGAPAQVFGSSVTTGLTVTGASGTAYTTNADGTTFTLTTDANVAQGTDIDLTLGSAFMVGLVPIQGPITLTIYVNTLEMVAPTTGFGTIYAVYGTGNDPIARFGNKEVAFELPVNELTPLVTGPDFKILGSVFEGQGPWEQWFDRMILTTTDDDRFMEIRMVPNLHALNQSRLTTSQLGTLNVTLGWGDYVAPARTMAVADMNFRVPESFMGHQIAFRRIQRHFSLRFTTVGRFRRECVEVAGDFVHMYICSSPAAEYLGNLQHLALKFAHLDLVFLEVTDVEKLTGLLPELWDMQPMTENTKRYVKLPAQVPETKSIDSKSAWAGGIGMEDIQKECNLSVSQDAVLTV